MGFFRKSPKEKYKILLATLKSNVGKIKIYQRAANSQATIAAKTGSLKAVAKAGIEAKKAQDLINASVTLAKEAEALCIKLGKKIPPLVIVLLTERKLEKKLKRKVRKASRA